MKILAVADEECPALWDRFVPGRLDGYDLILSCGDLKAEYLTFLVTMGHARLFFVRGNHDGGYASAPPEGCDDIDGCFVTYNGVRILGLGGCMRYNEGDNQYEEREMKRRVASLKHALKKCGGVDVVVTHAPPFGLGDTPDPAHVGFKAFVKLIEEYQPKYFLHGHVHRKYDPFIPRIHTLGNTQIINVCDRYELPFPDVEVKEKDRDKLIRKSKFKEKNDDFVYIKNWQ